MNRARSIVALPALAVVALGLTACQQPAPGATVYSGTHSVHREAACWAPAGTHLAEDTCTVADLTPPASADLPVLAEQTVGISVDQAVAEIGWFPVLGSTRLTETPITSTYWRFTPTTAQAAVPTSFSVVAGGADGTRGIWTYRLVPAT